MKANKGGKAWLAQSCCTAHLYVLVRCAVIQEILAAVGGKGGGKEGMAQGFLASSDLKLLKRWANLGDS